jgi:hypothetical protein
MDFSGELVISSTCALMERITTACERPSTVATVMCRFFLATGDDVLVGMFHMMPQF